MSFLLDTNICSEHLKRQAGLVHRFIQHSGRLHISTVVLGELYAWAHSRKDPERLLRAIRSELLVDVIVLPYDAACAEVFGKNRGELLQRGIEIDPVDLMIGATALVHDFTLVTHNTVDFQHIPGLRLEDWLEP